MLYWALGLVALVGLGLATAGAMALAARVAARLLGVPGFRWFSAQSASGPWWKLLSVRLAAALGPFVVSALLFWVTVLALGVSRETERVEVLPGPARDAGMQDGDRVVRVGERQVATWDEMRRAVQRLTGPTQFEVERNGQRLELLITPRDRRISVTRQLGVVRLGPVAAAQRAVAMPWEIVRMTADRAGRAALAEERTTVAGPVALAKEAGASQSPGRLAYYLATLVAYFWPFLACVGVFDALTAAVFRAWHPEAGPSPLRGYRLQHLRQTLALALLGNAVMLLAMGLVGVDLRAALVPMLLTMPASLAFYPLIWIASRDIWRRGTAAIAVLVVALVPGSSLVLGVVLLRRIGQQLHAEGFSGGWLRVEAPSVAP